jgi:hypothetical protein
VLLALLTPWWRLGAGPAVVVIVVLGAVSVPLLRLWWEAADTSEWVCRPVPAAVAARIEGAMTHPGERLRGARAARHVGVPGRWVVAADVQGVERYRGDRDIAVWLIVEDDDPPDGRMLPSDAIFAVNYVADLGTNFPYAGRTGVERQSDRDAVRPAVDCATTAVAGG